jgi:HAD superfamily phosphatase (TIGR01668 family)
MFKFLYPDLQVKSLLDIALPELMNRNIKAFIFDLDNTITLWNSNEIQSEVSQWFKDIRADGFKACILSNNGRKRIVSVANELGIPFIHRAGKPNPRSFLKAAELMGVKADQTAVIGDQIFTDVLGGNRAGMYTILVVPLGNKEFAGTKISRLMERILVPGLKNFKS